MVAAARFSDLPELRELRQIFNERYGNSLEIFATKEFVENLSSKPSTMEKKMRLMEDIASEFSISWDAKAFQLRMRKPSSAQEQHQPKVYGSFHVNDDKNKSIDVLDTVAKRQKDDAASKQRFINDGCRLPNENESNITRRTELNFQSNGDVIKSRCGSSSAFEENVLKRANSEILIQGRQEATSPKHDSLKGKASLGSLRPVSSSRGKRNGHVYNELNMHDENDDNISKGDCLDKSTPNYRSIGAKLEQSFSESDGRHMLVSNSYNSSRDNTTSTKNEEGTHKLRHCHGSALPPPYTKPSPGGNAGKYGANIDLSHPISNENSMHKDQVHPRNEMKSNLPEKIHQDSYYADRGGHGVAPTARKYESGNSHPDEVFAPANPLPKPRSSRRKHSKAHSNHEDVGKVDDARAAKRRSRSRRRDDSRRGLQILFDDEHYKKNEDERMIDKLLLHYSTKPSASEPEKVRKTRSRHADKQLAEASKGVSKDTPDEITEMTTASRSISLPCEQPIQSEPTKVFTRAATFQADRSSPARHVHPKLPDYDDLAARFSALKGR